MDGIIFLPAKTSVPLEEMTYNLDELKKFRKNIHRCPLCEKGIPIKKVYPRE